MPLVFLAILIVIFVFPADEAPLVAHKNYGAATLNYLVVFGNPMDFFGFPYNYGFPFKKCES